MKVTFLGGGSLRLLPILRGVLGEAPEVFRGGEIRLCDRYPERSEAVARLVSACPEYQDVACPIICTSDVEEALTGIDVLYLTMGARREPTETQAAFAAQEHGYYSSDQLSVNGAFLSLRLGATILDLARKMEHLCPRALMLIFPNPVAVYSCMVNTYTRIRALGICGGFSNHRWDLSRLCFGKNVYDPSWKVVAAGVNHLSFILRGSYEGEDLYGSLLPRVLSAGSPYLSGEFGASLLDIQRKALGLLEFLYRRHGTMVFSTEGDGLAHMMPEVMLEVQKKRLQDLLPYDPVRSQEREQEGIRRNFESFISQSMHPDEVDWSHLYPADLRYGKDLTDVSIPILKALSGSGSMRITASRPNWGAVEDFPHNASLEYTMDISKDGIVPVEHQYVPHPFQGLIASLSEFQTLQAQAIAQHDPQLFADALEAYPIHRLMPERRDFFRKMFDIYTDLDSQMLSARRFFE